MRIAGIAGLALLPAAAAAEHFTPSAAPIVALPRLTPAQTVSPPLTPGVVWEHPPVAPAPLSPIGLPASTPSRIAATPAKAPVPASSPPPVPPAKPQPAGTEIARESARETAKEAAKAAVPARRTLVATAGIYLRAAPDAKGRELDTLEKGDRVMAFGAPVNGWQRVGRAGKPLGYASSAYLAEVAPERVASAPAPAPASASASAPAPASSATAPKPGRYAKAAPEDRGCALPDDLPERAGRPRLGAGTVARLRAAGNLRVAPVCDAKVLDVLDTGERVTVLEAAGGWYRVGRKGKALGYVGAALLAPVKR
ncbi:SH3 domain-containing protein [Azospirillum sp. HJ39]|uniref:SH3 domain-containing protein n=1 Tax=Azospirillum sp. HJ39 TaxID=3159496 RepID=UPI0035584CE1